jgi:hypothetical protein
MNFMFSTLFLVAGMTSICGCGKESPNIYFLWMKLRYSPLEAEVAFRNPESRKQAAIYEREKTSEEYGEFKAERFMAGRACVLFNADGIAIWGGDMVQPVNRHGKVGGIFLLREVYAYHGTPMWDVRFLMCEGGLPAVRQIEPLCFIIPVWDSRKAVFACDIDGDGNDELIVGGFGFDGVGKRVSWYVTCYAQVGVDQAWRYEPVTGANLVGTIEDVKWRLNKAKGSCEIWEDSGGKEEMVAEFYRAKPGGVWQ